VREAFEEQIAKGFLEWKAVDIDQPDNKHFSAEFDLSSPTLIVARFESGKSVPSKSSTRSGNWWKATSGRSSRTCSTRSTGSCRSEPNRPYLPGSD